MAAGLGQSKIGLSIHNNWGRTHLSAGDDLRALQILDEGVQAATTRWPGDGMPEWLLANHGSVLHRLARYDEALISFDKAVAAAEGNNSRLLSLIRGRRAATYIELGNLSAAEQELTALLPKIGATIPHDERDAVAIRDARARLDTARGNLAAALSSYTENVRSLGEHPAIAAPLIQTLVARAEVYLRLHQPAQALADAQRALDLARDVRRPNAHSSFVGESLLMRARVQESLGQHAEARASAAEAVSHLAPTLGAQHPLTVSARSLAS
jgi:tetratricopeptide (TPR) repeat protein